MMPQKSSRRIQSGFFYASIILLLAYCISFYAFFYTGNCISNYHKVPGSEVNTYNEIVIEKVEVNAAFSDTPNLFRSGSMQLQKLRATSILSLLADLLGIIPFELLIFVVLLFLRMKAVLLPDSFSLINHNVRLND